MTRPDLPQGFKIIGLTGPSGAGKGELGARFAARGLAVIDTDAVYHEILMHKNACTDELVAAFGEEILNEVGLVERKKLAARVFGKENTPALLHTLNGITHKYIMAKTREIVQVHRQNGTRAVLIDAPQLFEAGVEKECDLTLGVIAPDNICIERIMARDGISQENAAKRLAAQHDNEYFRAHCTAIVENTGTHDELSAQICQFLLEFGV